MYQDNKKEHNCNCGCNKNSGNFCNVHSDINNKTVFYFNDEPPQRLTYQAKYKCKWDYGKDCNCHCNE